MLTGLMPIRNGAMLNHQPPRKDVKKLPAYLHELGYEVVAIGKVAHYQQVRDYGFDYVSHYTFHDDKCVGAAVEYLKSHTSDRPLCLMVGTNWPHVPWPDVAGGHRADSFALPPTFVDTPATRQWRARYAAAVAKFDHDLGLVYDQAYKSLGKNTLFIEFSDQGAQWPFGKWNLYDAGTQVTFFAVWPGVISPGSRSDAMVSLVDVVPTLLEAAGGSPPSNINGRSMLGVLTGKDRKLRDQIFTTHSGDGKMNSYPIRSVRTRGWKYILNLAPHSEHHTHIDRGVAVDGRVYWDSWAKKAETDTKAAAIVARYHHRPAEELYDLDADPYEQHNLAADPGDATVLQQLRLDLRNWMSSQGDNGLGSEREAAKAFPKAMPASAASSSNPPPKTAHR